MKVAMSNSTAIDWLLGLGLTSQKVNEVSNSFSGGAPSGPFMYSAEHLFVRFHGKSAPNPIFRPNYWVDGSALRASFARVQHFEGWLTDAEIAKLAKQHYRDICAISHNWNDLSDCELWKIELRGTEVVQGIEGPIASQPTHQATQAQSASLGTLRGGAIQVYLDPKTPFVCTPVDWNVF